MSVCSVNSQTLQPVACEDYDPRDWKECEWSLGFEGEGGWGWVATWNTAQHRCSSCEVRLKLRLSIGHNRRANRQVRPAALGGAAHRQAVT